MIYGNVVIGKNCMLGQGVNVEGNVCIGDNVRVQNLSQLYGPLDIEDNVFIGPGVIFCNDKYPKVNEPYETLRTIVGEGASIGAGAVILPGIFIGPGAMVGAGSVVTKDVKSLDTVAGNPAKVIT